MSPGVNFRILDLDPATWYQIRVVAHNAAGSTKADYEFATLTATGATVAPPHTRKLYSPSHNHIRWYSSSFHSVKSQNDTKQS